MPARRRVPLALTCVALGSAAGWAAVASAGPAPADAETERLLAVVARAEPVPAWDAAVRTLKAGTADQRARAAALLTAMTRERHAAWSSAVAAVTELASKVGDGRAAAEALAAWDAARGKAHAWIFDPVAFPVPADPKVTGPREGYPEAKARGDAAVRTWGRLEPHLARALAPALKLSAARARELAGARERARAAFARVVAHAPDPALAPPVPDRLADHLLALRAGEWKDVREAFRVEPPGWRRLCLFHAYGDAVLAFNEERPFAMEVDAIRGLRAINDYRRALGISPVAHDERLVRAARGHSTEMAAKGFFSHRSPTQGRETKEQRAALEGYLAPVVECITGAGGGTAAVEFWKFDGGHHRDLVNPRLVEGGFSTRGPAVYDAGTGGPTSLPVLEYGPTATGG